MRRVSPVLSLVPLLSGCMALAPGPNEPTSAPPLSSVTEPILPAPVAPGPPPEITTPKDHPVAEPVTNVPPPPPAAESPRGEERQSTAARPAAEPDERPARMDHGKSKRHHKAKKKHR